MSELLSLPLYLHLESWALEQENRQLTFAMSSAQLQVSCPVCKQLTTRVHSRYQRTLADLSWVQYRVLIHLNVRKYFCCNPQCERRIFTERLPQLAVPWARRTERLAQQLVAIAIALGGAAGARLSQSQHCGVSRNTLLRLLRKQPLPPTESLTALGVDDFAFRKRHSYGTILVDLERHRPVELLVGRDADTLAAWLKPQRHLQVLSRDRFQAYKSGMTQGAPGVLQVADRFHLVQNLGTVVEQTLRPYAKTLKSASQTFYNPNYEMPTAVVSAATVTPPTVAPVVPEVQPTRETEHYAQRRDQHQTIWQLFTQHWSTAAIAARVGVSIRTVQRVLNQPYFPDQQRRSDYGQSQLSPYIKHILQHYQQSQRRPFGLLAALRQYGYRGSERALQPYLHQLRESGVIPPLTRTIQSPVPPPKVKLSGPPPPLPLTSNRTTWLLLCRPEHRDERDEALLNHLQQEYEQLADLFALTYGFLELIRQRLGHQLDDWLEQASNSDFAPFRRFAKSLKDDYDAVRAGVTSAISNGQVEGQVNRLKMLKRQMYGRAGIDLLRHRFLLTS